MNNHKYQQIRDILVELKGRATIELLAKKVYERDIYEASDFSGCIMAWIRDQCRNALREVDPVTDLQYAYVVRPKRERTSDTVQRDLELEWMQPDIIDYPGWCSVIDERVGQIRADVYRLQPILDYVRETFGKLPPLPDLGGFK